MANSVSLEVITPSKSFYKGECELIIVTTIDGEEGFMAGHSWALKLLDLGGLWVKEPGEDSFKTAAIAGGFIDVKDKIIIFTDAAEWREDIDPERAEEAKRRAQEWLGENNEEGAQEVEEAENVIKKAEARIKIYEGTIRDKD